MLTADTPLEIATSRYAARDLIIASGLAPVRITLGAPKFALGYDLAGEILELAPSLRIFRLEWDRFAPAYSRQLDALDWAAIDQQLRDIVSSVSAPGAVLLCYEDVTKGERCHRRLAAEWIEREAGIVVGELAYDNATLF